MSKIGVMGDAPIRILNRSGLLLALCMFLLVLAGCKRSEERAEEHYQNGLALIEQGDVDRALVEFRNVFRLNGSHRDARFTYARVQRDRGAYSDAYGQFLRLVEQYPNDLEGRIALSDMALDQGNWDDLERHASRAASIAPDNLKAQSLANILLYYNAVQDEDEATRKQAVDQAASLLAQDASLLASYRVVIDDLTRQARWDEALKKLDAAIAQAPDDLSFYQGQLAVLYELDDTPAIRAMLEEISQRFPENEAIKQSLVAFYVEEQDIDAAETFLRSEADSSDEIEESARLVIFLQQYRGNDAARAELERLIADNRLSPLPFQAMLAQLKFQQGDQDGAIADLEAVVKDGARNAELRDIEVDLAQLHFQKGNLVEARRLVEQVLDEDATHPGAVKLKASWLIQDDVTGDAIVLLRNALGQSPRDAELLTLMAQAHEREGNRKLMTDMLSLAVDASGYAPTEAIRYASALASDDKLRAAEDVLNDALRLAPGNTDLLGALGSLYIRMENWTRANRVVDELMALDTDNAKTLAMSLRAQSLSGQNRNDDLLSLLEGIAENPDTKKLGESAIFRARLLEGGPQSALNYVDGLLAQVPGDADYQFLRAGALAMLNRTDEAETIFRKLASDQPDSTGVWIALYRLKLILGEPDAAAEVLQDALQALPDNPTLRMVLADQSQASGQFEDAIAIYAALYEDNPSSLVVANNLASLLADQRSDAASLQRAHTIARRFRDAEIPALQDTYGWIAYRMGNYAEALPYLAGAAEGLPEDQRVQYHYGAALAAAGQRDAALAQLNRTAEAIASQPHPPEFAGALQAEIDKLTQASAAQPQD